MQKEWLLRNHELSRQLEEMCDKLDKSNLAIEGIIKALFIYMMFISLFVICYVIENNLCLELKRQKEFELSKKDATIADQVRKMEHIHSIYR